MRNEKQNSPTLVTVLLVLAGPAIAEPVITTDMSGPNAPSTTVDEVTYATDVSSSDLLHGIAGTGGSWNAAGSSPDGLNDGSPGGDFDDVGNPAALTGTAWAQDGDGVSFREFDLGAGESGRGYDITEIQSIAAWQGAGFSNQKYEVRVRLVGEGDFPVEPLVTVDYQPFPALPLNNGGSTKVNVTDDTGILASGVEAIRFDILDTTSNVAGGAVIRELDVFGTETGGGDPLKLSVESNGGDLVFTWDSRAGKVYDLLSSTDPEGDGDPDTWSPIAGQEGIAAIPPSNMLTISRPADPTRLYVVRERNAPPPPPIFFDDFETENGWSTGPNGGDTGTTVWQRGAPAADNFGPDTGFNGSTNCYGTNLTGFFGDSTDIYLRSPEIDLSTPGLTSATLSMAQFLDNDAGDAAAIRVLKSSDLSPLGDVATNLLDFKFDNLWDEVTPLALPAAAIGEKIVLEFQFTSNNDGNVYDGWYIDDVTVAAE